ncbi:MAG: hypothetical protein ACP5RS_06780, partial [Thermoplasmata archaeon]
KILQQKISDNPEKVYYGYFPFAYISKNLDDNYKNQTNAKELLKELKEDKILKEEFKYDKEKIFEKVWYDYICILSKKAWIDKKINKESTNNNNLNTPELLNAELLKLNNDWKNTVETRKIDNKNKSKYFRIPIQSGFYNNFLFFNNSTDFLKQKESFYNTISFDIDKEENLKKIDKTINKFLPSEKEFPNINYTEMSTKLFRQQLNYFFVYLLCFEYAFEYDKNTGHVFFYSDNVEFSYIINKKLKLYKNNANNKDGNSIFKVTWQQIINYLVENKASWSLENMYIISYQKLNNQYQEDIKYIGIPKLQASILLEDSIREAINLEIVSTKKYWLLEEFINGKPLYPIILNHISLILNNDTTYFNYSPVLYSLIIEANILNFKNSKKNNKMLFAEDYFDNYRSLVDDIKKDVRYSSFNASLIKQISKDKDSKNRIAMNLIEVLKAKDKNMFLNILFKNLNENKSSNPSLNEWIFEKIVENNISYEIYGLLLVANLC